MSEPVRTCIACRRPSPQRELIRLVRLGDAVVEATSPRLPGRGGYVHAECVELAIQRQAIRRTFGAGAELDAEVLARASR